MKRLINYFCESGLLVSAIKHSHCELAIDHPGTDSNELRLAGCHETIVSSPRRWAMVHEARKEESEIDFYALLGHMRPVDLVLVEGFKEMNHEKLLVVSDDDEFREENAQLLLAACNNVQAVITNRPLGGDIDVPVVSAAEISQVAGLIVDRCNLPVAV